ncbi:MAG: A24 family peptidase [Myxococcota bacterium]|nr:A24 family peptidase [Myxococcota bacterium]
MWNSLQASDVAVLSIVLVALYTDIKSSRVPNQLTFGAMGLSVLVAAGQGTVMDCLQGIGLALALMGPGWLLGRAIRAGDAKLLMAVGGFWGPFLVFKACLLTYALSIPATILVLVWHGRLLQMPKTVWNRVRGRGEEGPLTQVPWVPVIALALLIAGVHERCFQ